MLLVTGALLMATWGLSLLIAAFAGHTLISRVRTAVWALAGPAMWWGLSLATLITLVVNLVLPLQSHAALVVLLVLVLAGVMGMLLRRRPAQQVGGMPWRLDWIMVAWVVPMAGACSAIAILAAGMPTNYDTGLYHLNAIGYAHDFGTVPGLANLHDRLGFNASIYPLGAVLSNGLWAGQGFRVITGLFLVAMAIDATLRISRSRSRRSPGTGVMVVGTVLILGYAVQEPGRLIASPVADVMAAVLTVVSTAYLLDAVSTRRNSLAAATAVVVACLAATARPLGWVFVLLVVSVLLLRLRRDLQGGITWLAALLGGSLLMVMLARDVLLSGWLLYPLGLFSVPVEWRVPDPTLTREAISAWGRAPHMPVEVAQDWSAWFPAWATSLPRDWAIASLALLAMGAGCLVLALVMRHRRWPSLQGSWWLAVVPAAVTSVIWFITAPDPRFAWGLLLCIGLVPFASVIAVSPRARRLLPAAGGAVLCCALALSWFRGGFIPVLKDTTATQASLGPWSITMQLAPVKRVEARRVLILDGSTVIEPAEGLQCWSLFPLCRVPGSEPGIERRGLSPGDGFRVAANGLAG